MFGPIIREAGLALLIVVSLSGIGGWYLHALVTRLDDHEQHLKFHDSMHQRSAQQSRGGMGILP